jgi:hypothetical protein
MQAGVAVRQSCGIMQAVFVAAFLKPPLLAQRAREKWGTRHTKDAATSERHGRECEFQSESGARPSRQ